MAVGVGVGGLELLFMLLFGGGLMGGGALGMPPGEFDHELIKAASPECLIYCDWAARGEGTVGGEGVEGFAADPEVKDFVERLYGSLTQRIRDEASSGGPEQQIMAEHLPPLLVELSGRPGCLFLNYDPQRVAAAEAPPTDESAPPWAGYLRGLEVTLIVNAGDKADEVAEHIDALLGIPAGLEQTEDLKKQPLPVTLPGLEAMLHRDGQYYLATLGGEELIDEALDGLKGDGHGLKDDERFTTAFEAAHVRTLSSRTWIDTARLLDVGSTSFGLYGGMATGVARTLALDRLDSIANCVGVENGQIVSRTELRVIPGEPAGLWALGDGESIAPDTCETVPADADFVAAGSVDAAAVLKQLRTIVGQTSPPSLDVLNRRIEEVETQLGFDLEEDIFPALGQRVVVHNSPTTGGVFFSSPIAMLEVEKPEEAFAIFSKVMSLFDDTLPGETRGPPRRRGTFLAKQKFFDRTIYYVNIVGEDDIPFAPSFCFTGKHVLAAPHPQPIKAYLRFLDGEPSRSETFASTTETMLDKADGEVIAFSRTNAQKAVDLLYSIAPYVGQVILSEAQGRGLEMTVFDVPSAAAIRPYVSPAKTLTYRTERGIVLENHSALPIPGLQTAPAAALVPFFTLRARSARARAIRMELEAVEELQELQQAR